MFLNKRGAVGLDLWSGISTPHLQAIMSQQKDVLSNACKDIGLAIKLRQILNKQFANEISALFSRVTLRDRIKSEKIRKQWKVEEITDDIQSYQQKWNQHVLRMPENRLPC